MRESRIRSPAQLVKVVPRGRMALTVRQQEVVQHTGCECSPGARDGGRVQTQPQELEIVPFGIWTAAEYDREFVHTVDVHNAYHAVRPGGCVCCRKVGVVTLEIREIGNGHPFGLIVVLP